MAPDGHIFSERIRPSGSNQVDQTMSIKPGQAVVPSASLNFKPDVTSMNNPDVWRRGPRPSSVNKGSDLKIC
jgi:hypothetical protein